MNELCGDLITNITMYLNLSDTFSILYTEKDIYKISDSLFWKHKAYCLMGNNFWRKAHNRPIQTSKPLMSYKQELLRINKFQETIFIINQKKWNNNCFYKYWESIDKPTRAGFEPTRA